MNENPLKDAEMCFSKLVQLKSLPDSQRKCACQSDQGHLAKLFGEKLDS